MKVAVVGAGAMGCLFAAHLTEAGVDAVLLDRLPETVSAINRRGVVIESPDGERSVPVPAYADPESIGERDLVLVCVKTYDTRAAAEGARQLVGDDSLVLSLQNGLGNLEILADVFGGENVLGGTTAHGATNFGEGRIRHAGAGDTVIGAVSEPGRAHLTRVAGIMAAAGFETDITDDLTGLLWSKLVVNVGINGLTALLRVPNGALVEDEGVRLTMRTLVEECLAVAEAKGIALLHEDPVAKVEGVARATGANRSSMLQDVLAGKRTEIQAINGIIVAEAEKFGIAVPANKMIVDLVEAIGALGDVRVSD